MLDLSCIEVTVFHYCLDHCPGNHQCCQASYSARCLHVDDACRLEDCLSNGLPCNAAVHIRPALLLHRNCDICPS